MEVTAVDDDEFLARTYEIRRTPLQGSANPCKVVFCPGSGIGLGDQFMLVPLLRSLRKKYVNSEITLVTNHAGFWKQADLCQQLRISATNDVGILSQLTEADLFVAGYLVGELGALSRLPISSVFCAGTDLDSFRGFFHKEGQTYEIPLIRSKRSLYEGDKFCSLFEDLGIACPPAPLRLLKDVRQCCRNAGPTRRGPTNVLLHPFSAEFFKEWPLDNWLDVITRLHNRGVAVYVSSGVAEREGTISRTIKTKCPFVHLLPQLSLTDFLGFLGKYDVVLSGDTFITHAVNSGGSTISLAVFGPTDPIRYCPPSNVNFFCSPFNVSPGEVVSAVAFLAAVNRGDIAAALGLMDPELKEQVLNIVSCLLHFTRRPLAEDKRMHLARLLRQSAHCKTNLKRLVIGSEEVVETVCRALAQEKELTVLRLLDQSPIGRTFNLFRRHRIFSEPGESASGAESAGRD